jgi:hypothetical protein
MTPPGCTLTAPDARKNITPPVLPSQAWTVSVPPFCTVTVEYLKTRMTWVLFVAS